MSPYRKAIILAAAFLAGALALKLAAPGRRENVWQVLVGAFPGQVTVENAHISSAYYILRQTHEPVLRKDDGQNYTSKILRDWAHDLAYKEYKFCPKPDLRFNERTPFTKELFYAHIASITKKYDPNAKISLDDGCAVARFGSSQKGYLEYLTLYQNAPTTSGGEGYELGLGQFYVEHIGEDIIGLARKAYQRNAYTKIFVHLYKDVGDPKLEDREISDFNLIPSVDLPQWVKQTYGSFDNVELKTANLIINHPDPVARKLVRHCLDVSAFRSAYSPRKTDFIDVQSIFPMGLPGAHAGLPRQNCDFKVPATKLKPPIVFLNNRNDNDASISALAKTFHARTGVPLVVLKFPPEKMREVKRQRPRPYNLIVIVIDATSPDHEAFFGPFLDPSGYHDFDTLVLRKLYTELSKTDDPDARTSIATKMLAELERHNVVLPLYQMSGRLYYPKGIKNINVGRGFLQYPEVAEFRL